MTSYQIRSIRFQDDGSDLHDWFPIAFATREAAQVRADSVPSFAPYLFEEPADDYAIVELDSEYVATGREWTLKAK